MKQFAEFLQGLGKHGDARQSAILAIQEITWIVSFKQVNFERDIFL